MDQVRGATLRRPTRDAGHGGEDSAAPRRAGPRSIPAASTLARLPLIRADDDQSGVPRIPDLERLRVPRLGSGTDDRLANFHAATPHGWGMFQLARRASLALDRPRKAMG